MIAFWKASTPRIVVSVSAPAAPEADMILRLPYPRLRPMADTLLFTSAIEDRSVS